MIQQTCSNLRMFAFIMIEYLRNCFSDRVWVVKGKFEISNYQGCWSVNSGCKFCIQQIQPFCVISKQVISF